MHSSRAVPTRTPAYKTVAFSARFAKHLEKRGQNGTAQSRRVTREEAVALAQRLRSSGVPIADDAVVVQVHAHNADVIRLSVRDNEGEPGFLAYLPLRQSGFDALAAGRLDRRAPEIELLCRTGETPVAIYLWCIYSPGHFMPAMNAIVAHFDDIAPLGVPLFTSAATPAAARLFAALGFVTARDLFPNAEADVLTIMPLAPGRGE